MILIFAPGAEITYEIYKGFPYQRPKAVFHSASLRDRVADGFLHTTKPQTAGDWREISEFR